MFDPRQRERVLPTNGSGIFLEEAVTVGGDTFPIRQDWSWPGHQLTVDEVRDEPWTGTQKLDATHDTGGDFFSQKSYATVNGVAIDAIDLPVGGGALLSFSSRAHVDFAEDQSFPPALNSSIDDMCGFGATAISRCEPTNQLASVSVALGELTNEGLPDLPLVHSLKKRAKYVKQAGKEFLNVSFGWLPLTRDVRQIAEAAADLDRRLAFYEALSGKPIRRTYRFPDEISTTEEVANYTARGLIAFSDVLPNLVGDTGERGLVVVKTIKSTQRWFSGAFTYYLPDDYDSRQRLKAYGSSARHLLGIELTPETLWNLAPWTWAADWVSNAGDVIHNVTQFATGGLIMHYGYIMEHTVHEYVIEHVGPTGLPHVDTLPAVSFTTETKQRVHANPYGFGVTWEGLSPFQISILSALGISRRR